MLTVRFKKQKNNVFERRTMMKKLMVLSLVLAVCGLANAGFSFNDSTPGSLLIFGDYLAEPYYLGISVNDNFVADIQLGAGAPSLTGFVANAVEAGVVGIPGDAQIWTIASGLTTQPTLINVHLLTISYLGDTTVKLFNIDGNTFEPTPVQGDGGMWTNVVVPEPMTMGLLSLGALFIRKRK
jgi:hypothetical protein